jgi:hypothetical protein
MPHFPDDPRVVVPVRIRRSRLLHIKELAAARETTVSEVMREVFTLGLPLYEERRTARSAPKSGTR